VFNVPIVTKQVISDMQVPRKLNQTHRKHRKPATQGMRHKTRKPTLKTQKNSKVKLTWVQWQELLIRVCVCHCTQLLYTTQHKTVLKMFRLNLQMNIIALCHLSDRRRRNKYYLRAIQTMRTFVRVSAPISTHIL